VGAFENPKRIAALLVEGLMIVVPAIWVVWSLLLASTVAQSNRAQTEVLDSLKVRLAALDAGSQAANADAASVYLPGATDALAGAALQRLVADTVERSGGRLAESEIARQDVVATEPGIISLRVSFEADIVGLQRVIFDLESGAPILMLQTLTVETKDVSAAGAENPLLNVVLTVRGYREA
jgi:general secretion pathway protein M